MTIILSGFLSVIPKDTDVWNQNAKSFWKEENKRKRKWREVENILLVLVIYIMHVVGEYREGTL